MQYLLMIYADEAEQIAMTEEQRGAYLQGYHVFTNDIKAKGQFIAGDALHPVAAATTVRVRDGRTLLTDGPFAETKEQLGGYYLVEAADLDMACEIASRIPTARHGSIEVRPIFNWEAPDE